MLTSQQIIKRRHLTMMILRIAALALLVYGTFYMIWGLGIFVGMFGISSWYLGLATSYDDLWNPVWYGLGAVVPGILLLVLNRSIARWLIPLPRHECPNCGYALTQLTTTRCPECGYVLSQDASPSAGKPAG